MKYGHLTNNTIDFIMDANPAMVFGGQYLAEFMIIPDEAELGWVFDGVDFTAPPTPEPTPEPVPLSITPRQIRLQLTAMGLRQQVEDWVATQPLTTKDWWEFSLSIDRNNQMLIDAAAHFGLTSEQLDQLFIDASKL